MKIFSSFNEHEYIYESGFKDDLHYLLYNNQAQHYDVSALGGGRYALIKNGKSFLIHLTLQDDVYHIHINGEYFALNVEDERMRKLRELVQNASGAAQELVIKAPIPGVVIKINTRENKKISKGEPLLILEAMKMENVIKASCDCQVEQILVEENQAVQQNQELIKLDKAKK